MFSYIALSSIQLLMKNNRIQRESTDFLETPLSNRKRIQQKEKISEDIKSKYIQELEERNRKIKYEIIKINEMLQEQKEKGGAVKKQHKLIPLESSPDVLKKELDNVYKQIKNYEREINSLETKQAGGMITDKMARLQNILKEKTSHLEKLKNQFSVLTRNSIDNSKKLKNNAGKEELENAMLKYNDDMKVLREKVRNSEQKEKKKMENAKKQYDYIKKLQRQLVENGVSMDQLQQMKKNNIFNQIYDKMNSDEKQPPQKEVKKEGKKEETIEDVTVQRYNEIKNQIKLYKKLHQDYDKRIQILDKERGDEEKKIGDSKKRLQERQAQIKKLQDQINEMKTKMRKNNIKGNLTSQKLDTKQASKPKPPSNKSKNSNQKFGNEHNHIKTDEKGASTQKGIKFTDKTIVGQSSNAIITSVKVWIQKSTFEICGIQCFYKIGDQMKAGEQHISSQAKSSCTQNRMQLAEGDFIKNVSCHLSENNIVEYLVLISNNSIIGRYGMAKPLQKQCNFDIDDNQRPVCLYGSLVKRRDSKKELTFIEQIGFQIGKIANVDKNNNKFVI